MKNPLILLLLITLCFTSCISAQVEEEFPKEFTGDLTVQYVTDKEVGLFSRHYRKTFKIDPVDVQEYWEYFFILQYDYCDKCNVINARVVYYGISPAQADKNNKKQLHLYQLSKTK